LLEIEVPLAVHALPAPEGYTGDRDELDEEDGLEYYKQSAFNAEEGVREQLLLALDPYPLCGDDCKGLCLECGANLNDGPCEHGAPDEKSIAN
jgi:uncharacterized protein